MPPSVVSAAPKVLSLRRGRAVGAGVGIGLAGRRCAHGAHRGVLTVVVQHVRDHLHASLRHPRQVHQEQGGDQDGSSAVAKGLHRHMGVVIHRTTQTYRSLVLTCARWRWVWSALLYQLRLHVGYGDGSGGVMSEVLAKREEEIGRMQAHFATLEAELRALRHEKVVYQKVYGEIAHIEQAQVDRLPAVNITEKLKLYEDISFKLTAECKAVALEAASLRPFVRAPRPALPLATDSLTHSGGSHTHSTCDREGDGQTRT